MLYVFRRNVKILFYYMNQSHLVVKCCWFLDLVILLVYRNTLLDLVVLLVYRCTPILWYCWLNVVRRSCGTAGFAVMKGGRAGVT